MGYKTKLLKSFLDKMPEPDKNDVVWDSELPGYGLRITPAGTKTFFYQGRIRGSKQLVKITIGQYGKLTCEQARTRAKVIAGELSVGKDPRPKKESDTDKTTFGALMLAYVELLEMQGKISARSVKNQIEKDIKKSFPKLWAKRASDITLDDCVRIIGALKDNGSARQADKLRSYIKTAYSSAINARGDVNMPASMRNLKLKVNPASDIIKVKGSSTTKDRVLSLSEFQSYWRHVDQLPEPARSLATIHVLTGGQRQQQLARVKLSDIDLDAPSMSIYDHKGRRARARLHVVPLLPETIEAIKQTTGSGEYVFSITGGITPAGTGYLNSVIRDIIKKMEANNELEKGHFTAGSIRATIETRLAAKPYRVSSDVLAQLLSHGLGGVQNRHYQRHDYFEEKLEALQALHRLLEARPEPSAQVIDFGKASA